MGTQNKPTHTITLFCRSKMDISGVKEVLSFDTAGAVINTVDGELTIEGSGIKIGELNVDSGRVTLSGRVDAMYYSVEAQNPKRSIFGRLFK